MIKTFVVNNYTIISNFSPNYGRQDIDFRVTRRHFFVVFSDIMIHLLPRNKLDVFVSFLCLYLYIKLVNCMHSLFTLYY